MATASQSLVETRSLESGSFTGSSAVRWLTAHLDRWAPAMVVGLLLFGLGVRLRQYLGCTSYWYDEAYLLLNIYDRSFLELIGPLRDAVVIPPLYLWLLRALYLCCGSGEWAMRLPAIVASGAALLMMIPLARAYLGRRGWLLALALCALSNHAMIHAYEVRPYSSDFLIAEIILLATAVLLSPRATRRARNASCVALTLIAVLGPWLSFPSVFLLAGASAALLFGLWRHGGRGSWVLWIAWNSLVLLSCLALWWLDARHLYYPGLSDHWTYGWDGFPADHTPQTVLLWSLRCFQGIGNYGSTGLGIPLLLLGIIGFVGLWRRTRPLALALVVPPLLGWLAALAGRYPMGDRTVFFAVPCVWLLAVAGVEELARRLGRRVAWVPLLLVLALLLPQAVRACGYLIRVVPKADYRGAFVYIDNHKGADDVCWVANPQVFEVYYGPSRSCLGDYTPLVQVSRVARGKRLWLVAPPWNDWPAPHKEDLRHTLEGTGLVATARHPVAGLEVVRYEPMTAK